MCLDDTGGGGEVRWEDVGVKMGGRATDGSTPEKQTDDFRDDIPSLTQALTGCELTCLYPERSC